MNEYPRKPVVVCNLLLLVGRPMALIGFVTVVRGVAGRAAERDVLVVNGVTLVASGFMAGWIGKIGRTLFK